ncbi:MAG: hypothetical protein JRD87_14875, partial [Deltaproteobacteria bacterium]|nr:hypothetical protein [Deltaproteobacteria bacterium]
MTQHYYEPKNLNDFPNITEYAPKDGKKMIGRPPEIFEGTRPSSASNRKGERTIHIRTCIALVFIALVLAGCSSTPKLMPTPNIYLGGGGYPESEIPLGLKSNKVELLFVTDRVPESSADGT